MKTYFESNIGTLEARSYTSDGIEHALVTLEKSHVEHTVDVLIRCIKLDLGQKHVSMDLVDGTMVHLLFPLADLTLSQVHTVLEKWFQYWMVPKLPSLVSCAIYAIQKNDQNYIEAIV